MKREELARELIENQLLITEIQNNGDDEIMSECSQGSDSDPAEDTLGVNEYENVVSDSCLQALKASRLCDPKGISSLSVQQNSSIQGQRKIPLVIAKRQQDLG